VEAPTLPEPLPRLDRHDTYVGIQLYVMLASVGIFLLPITTGVIGTMDPLQQKLLSVAMMLGSGLCLSASAMGEPTNIRFTAPIRRILSSRIATRIRHHPYTPLPTRHCYRLGFAGLIATVTAMWFFSAQLLTAGTVIGSMTGLLPPILAVTWTRKARKLRRLYKEMDFEYETLKRHLKDE
jgi:hypothetical protein